MAEIELLKEIQSALEGLREPANLSRLFCESLHWGRPDAGGLRVTVAQRTLAAEPVAELANLEVLFIRWPGDHLPSLTERRAVYHALSSKVSEHLVCYATADCHELAFVWAHKESEEEPGGVNSHAAVSPQPDPKRRETKRKVELRSLTYEANSPARTTVERLAELHFALDELGANGPAISRVTDKLERAFDVEAVTDQFFEGVKQVFNRLQGLLSEQTGDEHWSHDYALQTLNRLIFLYFIQRKRWLGDNPNFMRDFWRAYRQSEKGNAFFRDWLSVLFFEAFNRQFQAGRADRQYFAPQIRNALATAPYLNGGLFRKSRLDEAYSVDIPDSFFEMIFDRFGGTEPGLFERYNFTISESTPFDVEVAVDPVMIGKIYESLVNLSGEEGNVTDQRGTAGIFYTPRVEIDLMCRLALVDYLTNRLGDKYKPYLYDAVFAYDPDEKQAADQALTEQNLWLELYHLITEVTVCDPACGSGSFLVGMLTVLDDLRQRANAVLGGDETAYKRRRHIIGSNLYGVDVMEWAVHVAELRLWLQLIIETPMQPIYHTRDALLPNLSFKVRQGDSLVEDVGGINFDLHRKSLAIPAALKGKIGRLQGEKLHFYHGEPGLNEQALRREELQLFREILQNEQHDLQNQVAGLNQKAYPPAQMVLAGQQASQKPDTGAQAALAEIGKKQAELKRIGDELAALSSVQDVPFVWDIAFVEIFEGDKKGFDIVIGNPPYVRQELIAPPGKDPKEFGGENSPRWREAKKAYKDRLQESVAAAWPHFFGYSSGPTKFRKLDGKSDLYVYFYLHGLSLLNSKGSFCFITSNSWLDVDYGKELQEFLLRHSNVKLILDNSKQRSFAQADINTVIVLLGPADDRAESGLEKLARFVMFRVPFEEALSAVVFEEIDGTKDSLIRAEFRTISKPQRDLLEEGLEEEESKSGESLLAARKYTGNKWGGKYLRAPDIYYTILEKGKGKLVRLQQVANVRRGITTGANDFFYLQPTGEPAPHGLVRVRNAGSWVGDLEEDFVKPVIKSPRECRTIVIRPEDLKFRIFMCHKQPDELKGTHALEYIRWGEAQGFQERPSCRSRQRWWDLGDRKAPPIVSPSSITDLYRAFLNEPGVFSDKRLYEVSPYGNFVNELAGSLNSTLTTLFLELGSRTGLGEGLLDLTVYETANCLVVEPSSIRNAPLFSRPIGSITQEVSQRDRRALDDVVFDVLGMTQGEREAVYEAVIQLVSERLQKAKSL